MSLKITINSDIKSAMKEKDSIKLESLRAIKSAIILFETKDSSSNELNESDEIKILQRLVKQEKKVPKFLRVKIEMIWLIKKLLSQNSFPNIYPSN